MAMGPVTISVTATGGGYMLVNGERHPIDYATFEAQYLGERHTAQDQINAQIEAGFIANTEEVTRTILGYPITEMRPVTEQDLVRARESLEDWNTPTAEIQRQLQEANDKAEALFCKSLPEQHSQYKQLGYIVIPSKLFPD